MSAQLFTFPVDVARDGPTVVSKRAAKVIGRIVPVAAQQDITMAADDEISEIVFTGSRHVDMIYMTETARDEAIHARFRCTTAQARDFRFSVAEFAKIASDPLGIFTA